MTQLSKNFSLSEMTRTQTGLPNVPNKKELENLTYLCEQLELVRELFDGAAIIVSSGFRCDAVNKAIGGAKTSEHKTGSAADFVVKGFDLDDVAKTIAESDLPFGQLIREPSWCHISFTRGSAKRQVLTAERDKNGKMIYSSGLK